MNNLLILCPPIPPNHLGGDGKFALDIAKELSKRKLNITLFSPSYNGSFEDNKLNNYLRSIRIPIEDKESKDGWDFPIWEPTFTKKRDHIFLKSLTELGLLENDIWVHEIGGSIYNSLLIQLYAKQNLQYSCHVQFVLANYDKLIPNNRPYKKLTLNSQRELIKNSTISFFLSEMDAEPFKSLISNYLIVPNGVSLKVNKPHKRILKGNLRVFIGGRLYSRMKGAKEVFTIFSKLLTKANNLEVHICAPNKSYFELFDKNTLNKVVYHGWVSVEKTQEIIRNCHISLMPSIYEPFGLLALESLANGVPVLATKTGGLLEMIKPGVNGEFIDLNKPKELENILNSLAMNNHFVKKYKSSAIRKSITKYDISNIGDLYMEGLGRFIGRS